MNKRVEFLKKIVQYEKKKKLPRKLLVCEITIVLLFLHIFSFLTGLIKCAFQAIFPNKRTVVAYVMIGITLSILIMPYHSNKIVDEKVYGNTWEGNYTEISIDRQGDEWEDKTEEDGNSVMESGADVSTSEEKEGVTEDKSVLSGYTEEELKNLTYYIKVNRLMNCITIYIADESGNYTIPVKAMTCSTGGEITPLGVYSTQQKYEFRKLLYGVYGQYATRIVGQILFHSSSYSSNSKDTLIAEEFNKLGESVSHGCIRLTVADAKWIYDYCSEGTIVEIYEDENPGPLGKPEVIKIPQDTVWDPTDNVPENPWNESAPYIVAEDIEISVGHEIDLLSIVVAYDTCGNNISDRIMINGNLDAYTEGVYEINYQVTDLLGRKAEKTITITVKGF